MLKVVVDLHTHTTFSHGKNSIEENVNRAISVGLKEIGIADHGYGHLGFGVKRKNFAVMRKQVDEMNKKYPEIKVKLGVEANILGVDGTIDMDDDTLKLLDYVLAGYHFGSKPGKLFRDLIMHIANIMSSYSSFWYKEASRMNTIALVKAMEKYDIFSLTHPGAKGPIDIDVIAEVAVKTNTCLEINNHHGYLTVEQIKVAHKKGVKFIISSDAHHISKIGSYDNAIKRAEEAGLTSDDIVNVE